MDLFTKSITATAGDDYPHANIQRVVIPAGETQATVVLATTSDAVAESAETLTVGLRHGRGVGVASATNTLTINAGTGGGSGGDGGDSGGGNSGGGGSTPVGGVLAGLVLLVARKFGKK